MSQDNVLSQVDMLLQQSDALVDPVARELLGNTTRALMDLHGEALARIMDKLVALGKPGTAVLDALITDEMVSGLLLLYGLHPQDLSTRVQAALKQVEPSLASHSASVELIGIASEGAVRLAIHTSGHNCPSTAASLKSKIEQAIYEHAPDVSSIDIQKDPAPAASGFVSLENLIASAARHPLVQGASL